MRASPSLSQLWQPHSRLCQLCRVCEQQRSCSPGFCRKELHATESAVEVRRARRNPGTPSPTSALEYSLTPFLKVWSFLSPLARVFEAQLSSLPQHVVPRTVPTRRHQLTEIALPDGCRVPYGGGLRRAQQVSSHPRADTAVTLDECDAAPAARGVQTRGDHRLRRARRRGGRYYLLSSGGRRRPGAESEARSR